MEIQHTRGPHHWRIKLDEETGVYELSYRKRGELHWGFPNEFPSEEAAIAAVMHPDESLPHHGDEGHYPAAFIRNNWIEVETQ